MEVNLLISFFIKKIIYLLVLIFTFSTSKLLAENKFSANNLIKYVEKNKEFLSTDSLTYYYSEIGYNLNNQDGLQYLEKALKLSINNSEFRSMVLENMGNIHRVLGNNTKAIQYINEASKLNLQLKNIYYLSLNYSQIAGILYSDHSYKKASFFFKKALDNYPIDSLNNFNHLLLNINLGDTYRMLHHYDSASYFFQESINNNKLKNYEIIYGYAYGNLGMAQMSLNQKKEAEKNLKLGVHYLKKIGDYHTAEIFNIELGKLYLQKGQQERAERIFLKAYAAFKKLHTKEQIKDIASELEVFYEDRNQFEKALFYQKEYQLYKDSLINKKAIQELEQAKHQFELNKMEFDMELMEQKAIFRSYLSILAGTIAFVLLILAIYLFYESKRRKRTNILLLEQKNIIAQREEEKALLLKELNHRVKNNLQMISSLLNLQSSQLGDHPAVTALNSGRFRVEAMSLIHQKLYQKDVHTEIEIDSYIRELVLNLMYSFHSSFQPFFEIEKVDIHIDKAIPLGLIINEFVTNAMKYAFTEIEKPQLKIELKQIENQIILKVKDNGVGLQNSESTGTSFGLHLVDSLVQQLDGSLVYESDDGVGTTCILIINKYDQTN